uniref:AB hydrolase-1 domain-containing protein n=1 Tax=Tanacetum cinerariifolium TaxID=118510 RepID=A0A6L2NI05_TANCI|nr:hypothetical protein [Tanacetum cinerariifolium]
MSVHPSLKVSGGALDSFLPASFHHSEPPSPYVRFRRECIWTKDKGVVTLDWVAGDDRCLSPKSPILVLVPGLANGSGDLYVRHMVLTANKKGWRVVAFNHRGCGRSPVITPKEGDRCLLSGAVSLCSPFNVVLTDEDLNKGFNKVYSKVLGASLSKVFRR